jgi:hypothetical protein
MGDLGNKEKDVDAIQMTFESGGVPGRARLPEE